MNFNLLPDILTPEQLIDFLPYGRNKIYELLKNGKIQSIKEGRKYIIPKHCLLEYLDISIQSCYNPHNVSVARSTKTNVINTRK